MRLKKALLFMTQVVDLRWVGAQKKKQHENQQLKLNLYLFAQNWNANFCFVKYLVFMGYFRHARKEEIP